MVIDRADPVPGARAQGPEDPGPYLEVVVELGDDSQNLVMLISSGDGLLSWVVPDRSGRTARFAAPMSRLGFGGPGMGNYFASSGRTILSLLTYPVAQELRALGARGYRAWEKKRHPSILFHYPRLISAGRSRPAPDEDMDSSDWRRATAGGRSLLLVHGTASRSSAAFSDLAGQSLADVCRSYGGRVFAFDHPTVSVSPEDNVAELLSRICWTEHPVDIVCHSRGGLVARLLAVRGHMNIGKIVFVGVPNDGTELADPSNLNAFVDTLTTAANLMPTPQRHLKDVLAIVLRLVRAMTEDALVRFDGLASMNPGSPTLAHLARTPTSVPLDTRLLAVTSEYTSPGGDPLKRIVNGLFSRPNDLVVPTSGVANVTGAVAGTGFPIPAHSVFQTPEFLAVWHCGYFRFPEVRHRIVRWLAGGDEVAGGACTRLECWSGWDEHATCLVDPARRRRPSYR
ncbi:esterase/lipase family protein [Kineosporia succinea]|uniref:Pimeloyl-ACP methyl ester carboxylesterase n=1 Tax=Kineosporia succinea TaxID=84632 RepID=A0ABT9PCG6_9ACTN|nr:alpha/beta fold hydrolase [Kineosporia succinea]MDP9830393.1 pimeloyl-ACP methyl ester carboxylesterase [Kineosporia succinea]